MAPRLAFNWLPFIKFSLVLMVYVFAGGLLIFYIEECRDVPPEPTRRKRAFLGNITAICHNIAGQMFLNTNNSLMPKENRSLLDLSSFMARCYRLLDKEEIIVKTKGECAWNWKNLRKWIKFVHNTLATIGYHDFKLTTEIGRSFFVFYSILGVPLAILCYIHFGGIVRVCIRRIVRNIEAHFCNRTDPRNIRQKVVFYNAIIIVMLIFALAGIVTSSTGQWSFIECLYYFSGTISTAGNDDVGIDVRFFEINEGLSVLLDLLQILGLGLVSSLIQSGVGLRIAKQKRQRLPLHDTGKRTGGYSAASENGPKKDVMNGTIAMDSLVILVRNDEIQETTYT